MDWYWIVLIAVAAAAAVAGVVAAVCFACRKKKKTKLVPVRDGDKITVEEVAAEEIDEARLCEIEDTEVADRVKALMPEAIRAEISAGLIVTTCSKTMYKVILPASAKLMAAGGPSALLSSAGAPVAAAQVGVAVASSFSTVMSVASMVVGQYYMTLVNQQLKKLSEGLSRLGEFQDNEFKSKVFALHAQIARSAAFRAETMADASLREAEIGKLDRLEHECIELLGQAALMISSYTGRTDLDYQRYVRATTDVENWYISQRILLSTLHEIADLKFALHLGAASREQCDALLPIYAKQAEETQHMLLSWHTYTTEKLGIKLDESKCMRRGFDKAVHWLPGLFKKDLNYRNIPASTVALIEDQIAEKPLEEGEQDDLFRADVEIIAKDGKLYYLPPASPKTPSHEASSRETPSHEASSHEVPPSEDPADQDLPA